MGQVILCVDDNVEFLRQVCELLEGDGYTTLQAHDGVEALAILDKRHDEIGLLIIDLALPELSGFEVMGAITRRPAPFPILAVSAVFRGPYLDMTRYMGADEAIRKPESGDPLPREEWLGTVRRLLADGSKAGHP